MKIAIVGAGPAGLYLAILLRRQRPDAEIRIFEQNRADATFGFGVVFSHDALLLLQTVDPQTHAMIRSACERWDDIQVSHCDQSLLIDGIGFAAIGRLELLRLLQSRLSDLGLVPHYETKIQSLEAFADFDLLIGADGFNSVVRAGDRSGFGEQISQRSNKFVWYGADRPFNHLTQTFISAAVGRFTAHHYRFDSTMSTFIVECDVDTWARAGFGRYSREQSRAACEALFAAALNGARLIDNQSTWRSFAQLRNDRWYVGNRVLLGDALHTCHFSIGSGTRLALEDAIALADALERDSYDPLLALPAFQAARQPIVDKFLRAGDCSATWYESFPRHMALEPWAFAHSYIQRTGRVSPERLNELAPRFSAQLRTRQML